MNIKIFILSLFILTSCSIDNNNITKENIEAEKINTETFSWKINQDNNQKASIINEGSGSVEGSEESKIVLTKEEIYFEIIKNYYSQLSKNNFQSAYDLRYNPSFDYETFLGWFEWLKSAKILKYEYKETLDDNFILDIKLEFSDGDYYYTVNWNVKDQKFSIKNSKKYKTVLSDNQCNVLLEKFQIRNNNYKNKEYNYQDFIKKMKIKKLCFNENTWKPFVWVNWDNLASDYWEKFVIWLWGFNSGPWWDAYLEYSTYDFEIWSEYPTHATKDDYLELENKKKKITVGNVTWYILYEYGSGRASRFQKKYIFPFNDYYIAFVYSLNQNELKLFNIYNSIDEVIKELNNSEETEIFTKKWNFKIIEDFVNKIEFLEKQ